MEKMDILLRFLPSEIEEDQLLAKGFVELALRLNDIDLDSREKTIAMERLEESYMWAKKGLFYTIEEEDEEDLYGDTV
jgi:hypothetical protein